MTLTTTTPDQQGRPTRVRHTIYLLGSYPLALALTLALALPAQAINTAASHASTSNAAFSPLTTQAPEPHSVPVLLPSDDPDDDITSPGAGDPENFATGTFAVITKATANFPLNDGPDFASHEYVYDYSCGFEADTTPRETGIVTTKGDGKPVVIDMEFPVAYICTVTPRESSVGIEHYSHIPHESITVDIDKAYIIRADFSYHYTMEPSMFDVSMRTRGPRQAKWKVYSFTYECSIDGLPLHGKDWPTVLHATGNTIPSGQSPVMPVGTVCTVTQDLDKAHINGYVLQDSGPRTIVLDSSTAMARAWFRNIYIPATDTPPDQSFPGIPPFRPDIPGIRGPLIGDDEGSPSRPIDLRQHALITTTCATSATDTDTKSGNNAAIIGTLVASGIALGGGLLLLRRPN